jgi:hypothetical protein
VLTAAVKELAPTFADDPDFTAWSTKVDAIKAEYPKA